jgi:hypothetical protein
MKTETTHNKEYSVFHPHLYIAFEPSNNEWKFGFTLGFG